MKTKNAFLDQLNSYQAVLMKRNIEVTLIAGNGEETILSLEVIPSKSSIKWVDGKVIGAFDTMAGDKDVVLKSAFCIDGDKYIIQGNHIDVLYKSEWILRKKLE